MRLLISLFIGFITLWGMEGYNGKSIIITLPSPAGVVSMNDLNISVLSHPLDPSKGIVILPIDYYTPSGEVNLTWISPGKITPLTLNVQSVPYPTETLSVDPAQVSPPPEALERIARERAEAMAIYEHFTPIRYWNKPFIKPIDSIITSEYGSARTYNGSLKSYHGGVDFRAKTPIPILASNDGIVVLTEERYYSGGTIIIDHGEGLYTCYFHLSRFDVNVGDYVKQGQPIALSGASGRITGPHLHFGIMVHGIQADPLDLLAQINTLFLGN
ncbi:MAG: M23 family metallopeptidase [Sulfuricurvum sp.]|uniref:M23 family metallopeptidase n=1 Tax=Sulfuricurvum sp. TaxID=2025608 RepID=UPI002606264B|nr:M23 family metallopeptidase [Sulfuricurvum sp.]MDD2367927.1 M23 family metallopeptidase [Sulfuricurvum sp.]MDD2949342.1 M23 family metallopeptidase [Sulfuricurvum sp.]MDD5117740.1 M23 family metallopeptidase [Sulfuricurvum sp.]